MAKETERHGKARKKKLRGITIHKTDKAGEHVIEHHYEDHEGRRSSKLATATSDMDDLHQHIDDHLGADADEGEGEQPQPGTDAGAQPEAQQGQGEGEAEPEPEPQE